MTIPESNPPTGFERNPASRVIPDEAGLAGQSIGSALVTNHAQFYQILQLSGFDPAGIAMIDAAYDIAKRAHVEAYREGGERYFNHCRAVALILIQEAGVRDPDVITAALLHDSVEDTSTFGSYNIHGIMGLREVAHARISKFFNSNVADYTLAVTKIHKTGDVERDRENKQAYFEGLRTAPAGALLVKMADRLHNLRSVESRPVDKQRQQYKETGRVLLPIFEAALSRFNPEVPGISRLVRLVQIENEALGNRLAA